MGGTQNLPGNYKRFAVSFPMKIAGGLHRGHQGTSIFNWLLQTAWRPCSNDSPSPLPSPAWRGGIIVQWFETATGGFNRAINDKSHRQNREEIGARLEFERDAA
jgi:hypothetical protein